MRHFTGDDITAQWNWETACDDLWRAFREKSSNSGKSLPRQIFLPFPGNEASQVLILNAFSPAHQVGMTKMTTLVLANQARGMPLIHGLIIATDLNSGEVLATFDAERVTALRTAATAALLARWHSEDPARLLLIGAGAIAREVLVATKAVRPVLSVSVTARSAASVRAFRTWAGKQFPNLSIESVQDLSQAVADADIVCTATSTTSANPLVKSEWVKEGALVIALGGASDDACEVDPRLVHRSLVVVEDRAQAAREAAELRRALDLAGELAEFIREIGELELTNRSGRTVFFRSIGVGEQDLAAVISLLGRRHVI